VETHVELSNNSTTDISLPTHLGAMTQKAQVRQRLAGIEVRNTFSERIAKSAEGIATCRKNEAPEGILHRFS
jgi:hypothetical protein